MRLADIASPPRKRVLVVGDNSEVTFRIPGRGEVTVPSFNYSRLLARENPDVIVVGTRLGNPADDPKVFQSNVIPNLTVAKNIDATQLPRYTDKIGDSFDFVVFTAPRADAPPRAWAVHGKLIDDVLRSSEGVLNPGSSVLFSSTTGMPAGPRLRQMSDYRKNLPQNYIVHPSKHGFVNYSVDNIQFGVRGYWPLTNEGVPVDTNLEWMNWYRFQLRS